MRLFLRSILRTYKVKDVANLCLFRLPFSFWKMARCAGAAGLFLVAKPEAKSRKTVRGVVTTNGISFVMALRRLGWSMKLVELVRERCAVRTKKRRYERRLKDEDVREEIQIERCKREREAGWSERLRRENRASLSLAVYHGLKRNFVDGLCDA